MRVSRGGVKVLDILWAAYIVWLVWYCVHVIYGDEAEQRIWLAFAYPFKKAAFVAGSFGLAFESMAYEAMESRRLA